MKLIENERASAIICQVRECAFLRTPKFNSELGLVDVYAVKHDSRLASVQDLVTGSLTMVAVLMVDLVTN